MACEICGRGNCTRSFHSIEDQSDFDNVADDVKEQVKNRLLRNADKIKYYYSDETGDEPVVKLSDVFSMIEDIC